MNRRTGLWSFLLALVALRLAVGFHFFLEGRDKITSGNFQAAPFLSAARGPLAPWFHSLLDDPSAARKLCIVIPADTHQPPQIDSTLTLAIWDDFVDRAVTHFGLNDPQRLDRLADQIRTLMQEPPNESDSLRIKRLTELEACRSDLAVVRGQTSAAARILKNHQAALTDWLDSHRSELLAHFATSDRLKGFARDGEKAPAVVEGVEALRQQVDQIRAERSAQAARWSAEVLAVWDSLEQQINQLPTADQAAAGPLTLHRPFDQPGSRMKWVNRLIPWFDLLVGSCLILGLGTRLAAILAAGFLLSVVMTQPFWIPGSAPTYYQWVELGALLLLATLPRQYSLGLDMMFSRRQSRNRQAESTSAPAPQVV